MIGRIHCPACGHDVYTVRGLPCAHDTDGQKLPRGAYSLHTDAGMRRRARFLRNTTRGTRRPCQGGPS